MSLLFDLFVCMKWKIQIFPPLFFAWPFHSVLCFRHFLDWKPPSVFIALPASLAVVVFLKSIRWSRSKEKEIRWVFCLPKQFLFLLIFRQLILILELYNPNEVYDYLMHIALKLCADKVSEVRWISFRLVRNHGLFCLWFLEIWIFMSLPFLTPLFFSGLNLSVYLWNQLLYFGIRNCIIVLPVCKISFLLSCMFQGWKLWVNHFINETL